MADRSVLVRIRGDASDLIRAASAGGAAIRGLGKEIDTTNDRTAWMAQSFLALGPALAPLGASAVPVLAGLAAQMTAAGLAGGSMALAFIGIGDTMKAVNEYQLEPTAENFQKMQVALEDFGPAGADFVRFLDSVGPKFDQLQQAAREGMFPGMEEGIREFMDLLPQAERIVGNISEAIGGLSAEAGKGLAGPEFEEFFNYLETDAAPLLRDMGHTVGNFAEGLANMLVAFAPMSRDFSGGFEDMSRAFADWTDGLDESEGFADFIDYVQQSVPKVLETFEALAGALIQIVEAAAPVGDRMLPILEHLFEVIGAIADTPLGSMFIAAAAGMSVWGRAVALANVTTGGLGKTLLGLDKGFGATLKGADGTVARMGAIRHTAGLAAGGLGILALSLTDVDEQAGLSNTAMGALVGTMIAPGWGTAAGAIVGGAIDIHAAMDQAGQSTERLMDAIRSGSDSEIRTAVDRARADLQALRDDQEHFMSVGPAAGQSVWEKMGSDFNALVGDSEDLRHELQRAKDYADAGDIGDALVQGLDLTSDAFHRAAQSAEDFRDSVNRAFALLDKRAALRAARAAIRDFTDAMDEAPNKMRKGSAAYDKVEEALDNIARSSLDAAEHLRGMDRVNYLDRARASFIGAATDLGLTRAAARHLADQLGLLDKKNPKPTIDVNNKPARRGIDDANFWLDGYGKKHPKPTLDADNGPARGKINEADRWLTIFGGRRTQATVDANAAPWWDVVSQINAYDIPEKTVWITTRRRGTGLGAVGGADGMTVPGTRSPYGDKVFTHLAPGEEVISNRYGQADRHRELLKAINANSYENGGTVAHRAAASAGGTRTIERVVERLPQTIVLDAGELGEVVIDTVDGRVGDHRSHDSRQAATVWAGVTSD